MRDLIRSELAKEPQPHLKRLVLAEFLQHMILQSLYRQRAFENLVFTGGTALRILHHTKRYSEDLDFSLGEAEGFRFQSVLETVLKDLALQKLDAELFLQKEKTVLKADLKFPALLHELQLSPLKSQKLTVKLEIDANPPAGGAKEIALVTAPLSYTVVVFDLSSLFATKLHAVFFRRYAKGRDYYDLMWYLGKGIRPNFALLNNAILQTQGKGHEINEKDFREKLIRHLESVDFAKIRADVERFVILKEELEFLAADSIKSLLRNY